MTNQADDPNWPRASSWLAGDHDPRPVATLAVVGVPLHLGSITPGRCDLAPPAIRKALLRFTTYDMETRTNVCLVAASDVGDLAVADKRPEDSVEPIGEAVRGALRDADAAILLGGDNSVTRPACRGLGPDLRRTGLLTLDAHLDLRDTTDGLSNGNPVRALLEDGLPGRNIVQIGIQSFANSPAYAEISSEAGVTVVTAGEARARGIDQAVEEALDGLGARADGIYVDLDVDVLDRAFAPGCAGSRPGGLTPAEVQAAARTCGRHGGVRAIDIVEVDPTRDVADVTVMAAASFLLSFASGLAARGSRE